MSLSTSRIVLPPLGTVNAPQRTRSTALAVALLLTVTAVAYVLSRTTGLPGLAPEIEPLDGLGAVTTVSELVGAAAVLASSRRERR